MTTSGKIVLGILGAAAAGVVIGLLMAPDKGSETRKLIKRTTDNWADSFSNLLKKGKDFTKQRADSAKEATM